MTAGGPRTFFPKAPSTKFVVKNIAPDGKRVRVFNYPIINGDTRDLLSIPEISEAYIRHSLLKGELRVKFLNRELRVIDSDIDLLQFNSEHKSFLQSIGITKGLEVSSFNLLFKQGIDLVGTKNGVNKTFTTPDVFLNGNIDNNTFRITVFHNGVTQEQGVDFTVSESGGPGTGFDTVTFVTFAPESDSSLFANYITEL